jgi:hypothetical protein
MTRTRSDHHDVEDVEVTTADLLEAWREATRAAELAERLAALAAQTMANADTRAIRAEELAVMAERAAEAAEQAARTARAAAAEASEYAKTSRDQHTRGATVVETTRGAEMAARDAYHRGEEEARKAHGNSRD